jgi:hypothetical protein
MSNKEMRKTGLEPAQVTLLDPKSKTWPLIKGSTRPQGTERDRKRLTSSGSATQTATEYHREWRRGPGKAKFAAAIKAYRERNPDKRRAHWTVENAIRAGKLVRGGCEQEGGECAGRLEAHHDDYAKPLEVRWLCRFHHRRSHNTSRSGTSEETRE